ncbi:MAG: zinc finger CCCH domain-containing protein [Planctomycetaceae bacterium]|nr:zinc finger CCCH domain-containing protein [Planctomycetaceae bacterium]
MQRRLVAASAFSDEAEVAWLAKAWQDGISMDDLASSEKRFASLDFKLSNAVIDCIRGSEAARPLAQTVHSHETRAVQAGRCLRGRQIIHLMDQFFRTQPNMGKLYSIVDLALLPFQGDTMLADFRFKWDTIIEGMQQRLDEKTLEGLLAEKLKDSTARREDLGHYYRIKEDHDDRSYAFLRAAIDRCLEMRQQQRNREDNRQMCKAKAFVPLQPLAPAIGQAKAKPKAKAKEGTPKGKGSGKAPAVKAPAEGVKAPTDNEGKMYCWFFHRTASCRHGKDCSYSHQTPKKDILEALTPPRARSPSPAAKGGGKGKTKKKDTSPGAKKRYCIKFQSGECTFGDKCRFDHTLKPDAAKPPPPSPKAKAKGKAMPAPPPEGER